MAEVDIVLGILDRFNAQRGKFSARKTLSSSISGQLLKVAGESLRLRILLNLVLWDKSPTRSRFFTDVAVKSPYPWAARAFAEYGILDPKSKWQIRRSVSVLKEPKPNRFSVESSWFGFQEFMHGSGDPDRTRRALVSFAANQPFRLADEVLVVEAATLRNEQMAADLCAAAELATLLPLSLLLLVEKSDVKQMASNGVSVPQNLHVFLVEGEGMTYAGRTGNSRVSQPSVTSYSGLSKSEATAFVQSLKLASILSFTSSESTREAVVDDFNSGLHCGVARYCNDY